MSGIESYWRAFTDWLNHGTPRVRARKFWSVGWGACAAVSLFMALIFHPGWVLLFPVLAGGLFIGVRTIGEFRDLSWLQSPAADQQEETPGNRANAEDEEDEWSWDEQSELSLFWRRNAEMLKPLAACVVLLVVVGGFFARSRDAHSEAKRPAPGSLASVSAKKYERADFRKLVEGMTPEDVFKVLGKPNTKENSERERWYYAGITYHSSADKPDALVQIAFEDGKVVSIHFY